MLRQSSSTTQVIPSQYSQALTSTPRLTYGRPSPDEVCIELCTETKDGRRETISLRLNGSVTIGRNPAFCTYVIEESVVSSIHCRVQVIQSDDGGLIVSCEDVSTNGLVLNGYRIRRTSIILLDDDVIEIPCAQSFRCVHLFKNPPTQKVHLFDAPVVSLNKICEIRDFIVLPHCLGKGAFAEVHLGLWPKKCIQVACKTVKVKTKKSHRITLSMAADGMRKSRRSSEWEKMLKERDILMNLSHPNIIRVFAAVPDYDNNFLHIFLQLCTGGDLFTYLINQRDSYARLGEGETKYLMFQLFKALLYLHNLNIAHRDLKPENILLYTPGPFPRILIADFGLARPRSREETFTVCGTVAYLPPEAVIAMDDRSIGYLGLPGDCWSAGVLMFIMLAGYHPFDRHLTTWDSYRAVYGTNTFYKQNEPYYPELLHSELPLLHDDNTTKWRIRTGLHEIDFDAANVWDTMDDAKSLVCGLLTEEPSIRFTIRNAMDSIWIHKDLRELEVAYRRMASSAGA